MLEGMLARLEEAYERLSNRYSELAREKREIEQRLMEQEAINVELREWNEKLFQEVVRPIVGDGTSTAYKGGPLEFKILKERADEWDDKLFRELNKPKTLAEVVEEWEKENGPFEDTYAETAVTAIPISKVDPAILPLITSGVNPLDDVSFIPKPLIRCKDCGYYCVQTKVCMGPPNEPSSIRGPEDSCSKGRRKDKV